MADVTLNTWSLITLDEFTSYMKISDEDCTKYDNDLNELLNNVADLLERHADRRLKQHGDDAAITEYHDGMGCGHTELIPLHTPVGIVTSIHDDISRGFESGSLIDSDLYVVDQARTSVRFLPNAANLSRGVQNVKLIYTAGYGATGAAAVPEDLKHAARMTAAYALKQSFHKLGNGLLGRQQVAREGETVDWIENVDVPAPASRILSRYRRVSAL